VHPGRRPGSQARREGRRDQPAWPLAERPEQQHWLVTGLWADQAVGLIGGEPKCGKSCPGPDLAATVAAGTPCPRPDLAADRARVDEALAWLKPHLLILDPFVRLNRIAENAGGEVAPFARLAARPATSSCRRHRRRPSCQEVRRRHPRRPRRA
jgi:hypothetical protein